MIELAHATRQYRPGEPPALDGVSLRVARGESVALLGPSGAGKSTLIRCINGLVRPDTGGVRVLGADVAVLTGRERQALRRRIGMIFQEYNLIERLPVQVNALSGAFGRYPFWRNLLGLWSQPDQAQAQRLLSRVGLAGLESAPARELSGGQRQRVAIARAMMQNPEVLLADEPVASLDPATARGVMALIAELSAERGLTTLISLHDVGLAREYCGRAVGLKSGRILYDGPVSGLTEAILSQIYGA